MSEYKIHWMDMPLYKKYLEENTSWSPITIRTHCQNLRCFLAIFPTIDSLESYNNFLIARMKKRNTFLYYYTLKHYILFKIDEVSLRNRLIDGLIVPRDDMQLRKTRRYLDPDTLIRVVGALTEQKHQVIAVIQHFTGLRVGDILELQEGSIIPEEYQGKAVLRINVIGKGQKKHIVYIHDIEIQNFILNYILEHDTLEGRYFLTERSRTARTAMFPESDLLRCNYYSYRYDLKKALLLLGIDQKDFSSHDFRRCFARRVWEKYMDIQKLQKVLNHSDPKITMKYLAQSGMQNIDIFREIQE